MQPEAIIGVVLFLTFTLGWKLFDHLQKLHRSHNMFIKIGWIAEKENKTMCYRDSVKLRDMEIISYIIEEQNNLNIPEGFCVDYSNESEKQYAEEILNLHQNDVIKSYFHGLRTMSKNICKLNSLEYYFYSLYCFMHEGLDEYKNQVKICTNKEYTDKSHFTCQLTGYGRAYYKLFLIALMFAEKNERTRKLFEYIDPEYKERIMECLEKNEVRGWKYRS